MEAEKTQKVEDWFSDGSVFSRGGPNMSGDMEKIFHRSLDLLQLWVTDCRSVDFRQRSLVETVENFLNTEV